MSYYGIKNLKTVKTEAGYNVACEYYDSSIRSYEGYRVWHKTDKLFNVDFPTKAELEYQLFKDFLDGNLHTSTGCGKYQCLSWHNNQLHALLSEEEKEELDNLERDYYRYKKIERDVYYNRRYEIYHKLWQQYLTDKKAYKNNKFIIQLDYNEYKNIYVKSLGTITCKYTYCESYAKVFSGNPIHTLNKVKGFRNQSNIRVVEV